MKMTFKSHFAMAACLWLLSVAGSFAQDSTFTNSVGMQFILIHPGSFVMGRFEPPFPKPPSDASKNNNGYRKTDYALAEEFAKRDALPGFTANISKSFYIGKFEVTQGQWKKVMGNNPSAFQGNKVADNANEHPVENISWEDAQKFVAKLNLLDKSRKYRLPTEQEWEYAARAGATGDIPWPQIQQSAQLGSRTTNKVGQKKSNAWGLYDMLGNVWEWVQDYYNEKIFADSVSPVSGKVHVLKGASFTGDVKNATYMTHAAGPGNGWDVGIRVVMEANE